MPPRAGLHQRGARGDAGEEGLRGGVGEEGQHAEREGDRSEGPNVQGAGEQEHGEHDEDEGSSDGGEHESPLASPSIHQRAHHETEEDPGHDAQRTEDADLRRGRLEDGDDDDLDGDGRHAAADRPEARRPQKYAKGRSRRISPPPPPPSPMATDEARDVRGNVILSGDAKGRDVLLAWFA